MHAVLKASSFCNVKYNIHIWPSPLQSFWTSLQHRMKVLCMSAMALSTGNDFSFSQAEAPPMVHKSCLCRVWCDARAKLLYFMCLGNWEMAEILGKGLSQGASLCWNSVLVRSLISPFQPSIIIPSLLHLLFRADAILFNIYKDNLLGLSAPSWFPEM